MKQLTIDGIAEIKPSVLCGCKGLTSVTVADGVERIGEDAFCRCRDLEEIVLPKSIHTIAKGSFYGCGALRRISCADDAAVAGLLFDGFSRDKGAKTDMYLRLLQGRLETDDAFADCIRGYAVKNREYFILKAIADDDAGLLDNVLQLDRPLTLQKTDAYILRAQGKPQTEAALLSYKKQHFTGEQLEQAEQEQLDKAFGLKPWKVADWRKLFRFGYQDGGIVIYQYLGNDPVCRIPARIGNRPVVTIASTFSYRQNAMTCLIVPDGVRRIGVGACRLPGLEEVMLPASMEEIASYAFEGCRSLKKFSLAGGKATFGQECLRDCTALQELTLPPGVTLEKGCFDGCTSLLDEQGNLIVDGRHLGTYKV